MRDISKQTTSSFLLLVGPKTSDVVLPVIPARLFLDYFGKKGHKYRFIKPEDGERVGKSLASWLVYDVIGLWTGDPDNEIVKRSYGQLGGSSTVLIELEVSLIPTDN
jgi:hypothetical protein